MEGSKAIFGSLLQAYYTLIISHEPLNYIKPAAPSSNVKNSCAARIHLYLQNHTL
jgi:hypothetical protein